MRERFIADLFEQEPESGLLYMIDNEIFDGFEEATPWGLKSAMQLHEQLAADSCRFCHTSKEAVTYPGACGSLLSRLHEKLPQRFQKKHTNTGNVWFIHPPA